MRLEKSSCALINFILTTFIQSKYCFCFTDEETKTQIKKLAQGCKASKRPHKKEAGVLPALPYHYLQLCLLCTGQCTAAGDVMLITTDPCPVPLSPKKKLRRTSVQNDKNRSDFLEF